MGGGLGVRLRARLTYIPSLVKGHDREKVIFLFTFSGEKEVTAAAAHIHTNKNSRVVTNAIYEHFVV